MSYVDTILSIIIFTMCILSVAGVCFIFWLLKVIRELQAGAIAQGEALATHARAFRIIKAIEGVEHFVLVNKRLAVLEAKVTKIYRPLAQGAAFTPDENRYYQLKVKNDNFERMTAEEYLELQKLKEKLKL